MRLCIMSLITLERHEEMSGMLFVVCTASERSVYNKHVFHLGDMDVQVHIHCIQIIYV